MRPSPTGIGRARDDVLLRCPEIVQHLANISPLQHRPPTPIHNSKNTPPTFLTHARIDEAVPVAHSQMFYAALKTQNVPAELLGFPKGNYGYMGDQSDEWECLAKRVLAYFG